MKIIIESPLQIDEHPWKPIKNHHMAMAQNYQPPKWMVFPLNMIISVGHWYHDFEPNPYKPPKTKSLVPAAGGFHPAPVPWSSSDSHLA